MDTIFIHYGNNKYNPDKIKPIENRWVKPDGGMWASPINSEFGWKDWCKVEDFRDCNEDNSFKFKLKINTRILFINNYNDLDILPIWENGFNRFIFNLDFEVLSKKYDTIWLTKKGYDKVTFSHPKSLYGWDCESILVMNPKCCYEI